MRFNKTYLILLLLPYTIILDANAQVVKDTGEIFIEISSIISEMPGNSGNDYSAPSSSQLNSWGSVLTNLLGGNYNEAADTAGPIDYSLVQFIDTSGAANVTYYMLKATGTNYWGTYVYNPNYIRTLVIQSPHPKKDYNTGKEGIYVFHESNSFFFMLSGTSRCNNSSFSSCDGTTSICSGSSESYRVSDLSHSASTIFQQTTDTLLSKYGNTYFLQLHGFTKLASDPYVILSNGTQITPATDYIPTFKTKLFDEDNALTFKTAHIDLSWNRLRGFKNTQGRLINSSSNVCGSDASTTNGRFIHMEQEKTKLRANETGWNKVANAVINTFSSGPLPIQLLNFEVIPRADQTIAIYWGVTSEINNDYFTVERSIDGYNWEEIIEIDGAGNATTFLRYNTVDNSPYMGTSYYRLKQTDFDGQFEYSQARTVIIERKHTQVAIYPNPISNQVTVEGDESELSELRIYNMLGQEVTQFVKVIVDKGTQVEIDCYNLFTGIYTVKTKTMVNKIYKQ